MKLKELIVLASITLSSCHILQKDKLTLKKLNQKEEMQFTAQRNTLHKQQRLVLIDSSYGDFTTVLYPKGKFTFSLTKGFAGEAERIMIKGKHTSQKVVNLKQETKWDSTLIKGNYTHQKESSTTVKKSKLSFGFSWVWLLIIPIIFILYRLYQKYKKRVILPCF